MKIRFYLTLAFLGCFVIISAVGGDDKKKLSAISTKSKPVYKEFSEDRQILAKGGINKSSLRGPASSKNPDLTNKNNRIDVQNSAPTTLKNKEDFAFYRNVVRKNGWYVGVGEKLTKEEASHMNCYYKLSNKNIAGNWTLMQTYDGEGNLTTGHDIHTYLIWAYDTSDTRANEDWKEKLQDVCQWVFIDSYDGKTCVQEKSLDYKGNVIYSMVITPIDTHKFFYTYIDVWGRPIYMHTDSRGSDIGQANFVEVTRDSCGYEVLTKYYDRNGFPAKNRNGSYMLRTERNANGTTAKAWALNILGEPMIDDWGYCGDAYEYDANGNKIAQINIGLNGKPAKAKNGTYGSWCAYDQYGNLIEFGGLDENGQKCSNIDGIFKYIYGYSEHGIFIYYKECDISSNVLKEQTFNQHHIDVAQNGHEEIADEETAPESTEDVAESSDEGPAEVNSLTERYIVDTLNTAVTTYKYNNGVFYRGHVNEYKPILGGSSTMYNITSYGAHARTGNALYYKVLFGKNIMGGETMLGINEYGEPAYVTTPDSKSILFLFTDETSNGFIDYDEYGIRRDDNELDSLAKNLPRVFCIEVTDTAKAYPMGIHNNDIILSYGDWRVCEDVFSGIEGFDEETARQESDKKTMTVLRHHPETSISEVVVLELKEGTPQELGFRPRIIYYTQQEKKRLITTAKAFAFEFSK